MLGIDIGNERVESGLFEVRFGHEGISTAIGSGGADVSLGNLIESAGGLIDTARIGGAKMAALFGAAKGISTINMISMLGDTGDRSNTDLGRSIWQGKIKAKYGDLGMDEYGNLRLGQYNHDKADEIQLSQTLLGNDKELSARLASVAAHEGTHLTGNPYEAAAHMQGYNTYAKLVETYKLNGDRSFIDGIWYALQDPSSYQANTGNVDNWILNEDGSLSYDGDGWLKDPNKNYVLDNENKRIGSDGVQTGLSKILNISMDEAEALMRSFDFTSTSSGYWNTAANNGKAITLANEFYAGLYDSLLSQHNTLNIYNQLVDNGSMDITEEYKEASNSLWFKGMSALGLTGLAEKMAGVDKYISYDRYKANNFIQDIPEITFRPPLLETVITTFFAAEGNLGTHYGLDLRARTPTDIYAIFANDTTVTRAYFEDSHLSSKQGYHVDLTTDVSYVFKGDQRTDEIMQRYLHLSSGNVKGNDLIGFATILGKTGATGTGPYPPHAHIDLSTGNTGSPWLQYRSMKYAPRIQSSLTRSKDNKVYYDPLIFLNRYRYGVANGADKY
jgi:hypothetical protein